MNIIEIPCFVGTEIERSLIKRFQVIFDRWGQINAQHQMRYAVVTNHNNERILISKRINQYATAQLSNPQNSLWKSIPHINILKVIPNTTTQVIIISTGIYV